MLIQCPECELQVSDKASTCPHCGYPLQPNAKRKPRSKNNKRRRLPNGFGQISEIKGRNLRNPFRAMVTVGKTPAGRPICKPLKPESYFPTYNDAYTALVEYNKNPYDLAPSITVKELYEKWSVEYFQTLKAYSSIKTVELAWLYCSSIYDMRVIDVRARHIKGCMDEGIAVVKGHEKHANATTKNRIKSLFNLMLDYALEYELIDKNYARTFHLSDDVVKEHNSVKKGHIPFTDDEMQILWFQAENYDLVKIILIQCYSGWRPRELCLLEVENVDLENWTFKGGMKTEAGVDRVVPIHTRIRPFVLERYNEAKKLQSKYLINHSSRKNGQPLPLDYPRYSDAFSAIRSKLGLNPDHRPHDGRKHFVTMAKKYGVDEYAIKYMVGHKVSDITEKVYTQRESDWLQTEIEKIK